MKFSKETSSDGFGSACSGRSRLPICSAETIKAAIEGQQVEIVGSAGVVDLVKKRKPHYCPNLILVLSLTGENLTKGILVMLTLTTFCCQKMSKKGKNTSENTIKHHEERALICSSPICVSLPWVLRFTPTVSNMRVRLIGACELTLWLFVGLNLLSAGYYQELVNQTLVQIYCN